MLGPVVLRRRPPTEQSLFTSTHVALRGLKTFGTPEQRFVQVRVWLIKRKGAYRKRRAMFSNSAAEATS